MSDPSRTITVAGSGSAAAPDLAMAHHQDLLTMTNVSRQVIHPQEHDGATAADRLHGLLAAEPKAATALAGAKAELRVAVEQLAKAKGPAIGAAHKEVKLAGSEVERWSSVLTAEESARQVARKLLDATAEQEWRAAADDARLAREEAERALGITQAEAEAEAALEDLTTAGPKDAVALAEVFAEAAAKLDAARASDPVAPLADAIAELIKPGWQPTATFQSPEPPAGAGANLTAEQVDRLLPLLYEPLPASYVRQGRATKDGGRLVHLVTAQPVKDRLNAVFGPTHWVDLYHPVDSELRPSGPQHAAAVCHLVIGNNLNGVTLDGDGAISTPEGAEVLFHRARIGRHSDHNLTQARKGAETSGLKELGAAIGIGAAIMAAQIHEAGNVSEADPVSDEAGAQAEDHNPVPESLRNPSETDYSRRIAKGMFLLADRLARLEELQPQQRTLVEQFTEVFETNSGFDKLISAQPGDLWEEPDSMARLFREEIQPAARAKKYAELLEQANEWAKAPEPFERIADKFPRVHGAMEDAT